MAKVSVTLKVFPEDPSGLKALKAAIGKVVDIQEAKEEDIGFGVKALVIRFLTDEGGGVDAIEEKIAAIEGVSQVQVTSVDRAEI
ncbi:elongation factor 1-beta [Candidatus Micrarchaeota archaeon]|jgi:translation elongation factor aEF-1 beta|nr:elongation factor 1-beta [Candidatus Micrarchaeota archaeon]